MTNSFIRRHAEETLTSVFDTLNLTTKGTALEGFYREYTPILKESAVEHYVLGAEWALSNQWFDTRGNILAVPEKNGDYDNSALVLMYYDEINIQIGYYNHIKKRWVLADGTIPSESLPAPVKWMYIPKR